MSWRSGSEGNVLCDKFLFDLDDRVAGRGKMIRKVMHQDGPACVDII